MSSVVSVGSSIANKDKHPVTYHAFYAPYDDTDTEDIDKSEDWKFLKTIHWDGKSTLYEDSIGQI